MKKILVLSLVVIVSLSACKKRNCWKCTTKQANTTGIFASGAAAKSTECDKTEAEIRQIEAERSGTDIYTSSNGVTHTSSVVTTCK